MKFGAETGALCLVPTLRLSDVEFSSTTNLDLEVQGSSRSRRVFTSGPRALIVRIGFHVSQPSIK